ncbi:MAG: UvrD-helicase domain-containing protein [Clostridia bacterium]|nr:UvrD-helicase domain-containing protein [Clostridia bacterium]
MSRQWTAAQSAAMNIHDKTLLVSAAAGSGKTATLTERIIRRITDKDKPADISKMLIVTFTRAAADELKSRIFTALSEALAKNPADRHLTAQLVKLGSARICTIDSFYLDLVRSNFSALGIPASFRIADTSELEILQKSVMEDCIDSFYETDEEFPAFAECFTGTRSADRLTQLLIDLSAQCDSVPEGVEFLRLNAERTLRDADMEVDLFSTDYGKILRARSADTVQYCLSVFAAACEYLNSNEVFVSTMLPSFLYDKEFCERLLDALSDEEEGYSRTKSLLESFAPVRLKSPKSDQITEESNRFKALRTEQHKRLRELLKKSFSKPPQVIIHAMSDTAKYTETLYRVLLTYEARLHEEKLRRSIFDFNDIRRYTMKLLVREDGTPTPIALQYAEEFSDIYIDEYQDVDRVQDLIFRALSRPTNRFMVGDIKQSIYGFRGAEPLVFSEYRAHFPDHNTPAAKKSDNATVFMSENFRCDKSIIEFTNLVCSRIFSACVESIGYRSDDDLVFSKKPPTEEYRSPLVQVAVIMPPTPSEEESEEDELPEKKELEAAYIASEINRLITEEKKADGSPILAGDIAVLFRSRSMSAYVSRALNEYGILTSENDGDRYFENPDVLMVLCLLNTVDNPHRDIFLTGTLRSPIFGFTMEDLILIRKSCDDSYSLYDALLSCTDGDDALAKKCRRFDEVLTGLRQNAVTLPVDRFLRLLFESDVFAASGLVCDQTETGDGGNLLRLYEYARTFEAGSFKGLYNFIEFINTIIEEGKKMKVPPKGTSPDRVNLMTIHQSKGLEFPVCFLCDCGKRFNRQDQQASLLFDYPTGVAMKIADQTGFARINTPMREALAANVAIRQTEEEMRVLYVALTRARERLYVTAYTSSSEEQLLQKAEARVQFCGRYALLRCQSYLDWILLPFADPTCDTDACCRLSFLQAVLKTEGSEEETEVLAEESEKINADPILTEKLKKDFAFQYPYTGLRRIPAKLSVSRLSPDVLDEDDRSVDLFSERKKVPVPDFFLTGGIPKASAAERGTATHLFLQFCDFVYARKHGVANEIARLVERKFLPANIADLILTEELDTFFESEFLNEILSAKEIIREQRFNLLLSPEAFTQDPEFRDKLAEEKLAVQGVIDLILIHRDGSLGLYDYKTDRLSTAEQEQEVLAQKKMNERHGLQLSYYAHAVSLLFDRPCDRLCVYSTHAGKLFDIPPQPLLLPQDLLDTL